MRKRKEEMRKGTNPINNLITKLNILKTLTENVSDENHKVRAYRLNLISDKKSVRLGAAIDVVSLISTLTEMIVLREFDDSSNTGILYSNSFNSLSSNNKLIKIIKFGRTPSQTVIRKNLNNRIEIVSGVNAVILDIDSDFEDAYPAMYIFLNKVLKIREGYWVELTKSNRARIWIFIDEFNNSNYSKEEIAQMMDEFYKLAREFFAVFGCKLDISWVGNYAHDVFVPEVGVKTENGIIHGIIAGNKYNGKRHNFFEIYKRLVKFLKDGYKIFFSENGELIAGALEHRWSKEKLRKNPSYISKTFYENLKWYFGRNHEILTKLGRQYARKGYTYLKKLLGKEVVSKIRDIEKAIAWFMYQRFRERFSQYLKRAVETNQIENWRDFRKILESFKIEENIFEFDSDKRLEMFRRYVENKTAQYSSNRFTNVMLPAAGVAKALDIDFEEYEAVMREYLYDKKNLDKDIEIAWEYAEPANIDTTRFANIKRVSLKHIVITMDRVVEYLTKLIDNLLNHEEDRSIIYYDEKENCKYVRESHIANHICEKFQIGRGEYYYVMERLIKSNVVKKTTKSVPVAVKRRNSPHEAIRNASVIKKDKNFATNIEQIVIKYTMNKYSWFMKDKILDDFKEYVKMLKEKAKRKIEKLLRYKEALEENIRVFIPAVFEEYYETFKDSGLVPGIDDFPLLPDKLYRLRKFITAAASVIVDLADREESEIVTNLSEYAKHLKSKFGYEMFTKELLSYVLRGLHKAGLIELERAGSKGYKINAEPLKHKKVYTIEHLILLVLRSSLFAYAYSYIALRRSATYIFRQYLSAAIGIATGVAKTKIEAVKFFLAQKYEKLMKYGKIKEQMENVFKLLERGIESVSPYATHAVVLLAKEFEKFGRIPENLALW